MKQLKQMNATRYETRLFCLLLAGITLAAIFLPLRAHADGGAPNLAYVAGSPRGVGVIDVAQQRLSQEFSIGGNPEALLLSADGELLYVTQTSSGRVNALAARTGQLICSAAYPGHPSRLAQSLDGTSLYVASSNERNILVLDARTCALQRSLVAPEPVSWLSVAGISTSNSLQTQLWIAGSTAVSILSDQGRLLDSIPIAGGARFLCLPNDLTAYIVTRGGSVVAVDMLSHRIFATLLSGGAFGSMDYNAVTGEIYVPDLRRDQVDVLTPVLDGSTTFTQEPVQVIHVDSSPRAIAITNDGQFGFIARSGGKVDMLDIPGRSLVRSIAVGGEPRFVITGPYPPQTIPAPVKDLPATHPADLLPLSLTAALLVGVLLCVTLLIWGRRLPPGQAQPDHKKRENAVKHYPGAK